MRCGSAGEYLYQQLQVSLSGCEASEPSHSGFSGKVL